MILDISVVLHEAELLLTDRKQSTERAGKLLDQLLRDARNPMVMGDQRERALKLATLLAERRADSARV